MSQVEFKMDTLYKTGTFVDSYLTLRQAFVQPITHTLVVKAAQEHLAHVLKKDAKQLRMGVVLGDPEDKLELALRSCVGILVPHDVDAAKLLLEGLLQEDTPRPIRARAWSLLAHIHWDMRTDTKDASKWRIDAVQRAAACANEACALGFAPPGILIIGMNVEQRGYRRHEDLKNSVRVTDRFAVLSDLWRAVDRQKTKTVLEALHVGAAVCKDPDAYVCAAGDCGLEPTSKAPLRKCAGKCADKGKPAYCCKECQKKDWARHREFCRKGAPVDAVAATKRQERFAGEDLALPGLASINLTDPKWSSHFEWFLAGSTTAGKAAFAKKFRSLLGHEQPGNSETVGLVLT